MFKFFNKLIKTGKIIKNNLPFIKKEVTELSGVTKVVILEIIDIWD